MSSVRALSNYLRTHRRRRGFSQTEVAILLGCTHGSKVSRYERGERIPKFSTLLELEVIFGAPLAVLFAGASHTAVARVRNRAKRLHRELDTEPRTLRTKRKMDALVEISYPADRRAERTA
jgi:transcriptional regulator with XRE-family HTH domain